MHRTNEQRQFPRIHVEQSVKWRDGRGGRYMSGRARDISAGGMRIDATDASRLQPGQELWVSLPSGRPKPILAAAAMAPAQVVRCAATSQGHTFAVRFNEPLDQTPDHLPMTVMGTAS